MGINSLFQVSGLTYHGAVLLHYQENKFGRENEDTPKRILTMNDTLFSIPLIFFFLYFGRQHAA